MNKESLTVRKGDLLGLNDKRQYILTHYPVDVTRTIASKGDEMRDTSYENLGRLLIILYSKIPVDGLA